MVVDKVIMHTNVNQQIEIQLLYNRLDKMHECIEN